jgi:hypothetical protein
VIAFKAATEHYPSFLAVPQRHFMREAQQDCHASRHHYIWRNLSLQFAFSVTAIPFFWKLMVDVKRWWIGHYGVVRPNVSCMKQAILPNEWRFGTSDEVRPSSPPNGNFWICDDQGDPENGTSLEWRRKRQTRHTQ